MLADEYARAQFTMRRFHDGATLARSIDRALEQLPTGPVMLLSTSSEGAAVAAACAVARQPDVTLWDRVNLAAAKSGLPDLPIVFVEPVEPGAGWRAALARRYPDAPVVVCDEICAPPDGDRVDSYEERTMVARAAAAA